MSAELVAVLLDRLSGRPLDVAAIIVVAALAVALVLRAIARLLHEVPAIIEARRGARRTGSGGGS